MIFQFTLKITFIEWGAQLERIGQVEPCLWFLSKKSEKNESVLLFFQTRYDVEAYQRIEQLIGKKLDSYPVEEEEAMVLLERVTESQQFATAQLREAGMLKKDRKEGTEDGDDEDAEEESSVKVKKRKVNLKKKGGFKKMKKK
jgi:hypothetical protein